MISAAIRAPLPSRPPPGAAPIKTVAPLAGAAPPDCSRLETCAGAEQDWGKLAKEFSDRLPPKKLKQLAKELGIPGSDLKRIAIGWDRENERYTFPEFNSDGRVCGISTRTPDGEKKMLSGGQRGLYLPRGWSERCGPIFIVEGASDAAAMTAMGLTVVGRPSASGGSKHLAKLLAAVPANRPIIVLGEIDPKQDGNWPGREAAEAMASQLRKTYSVP